MSKRMQVLFPDDEYRKLKLHAKRARLTLGEWVRTSLRRITDHESSSLPEDKLRIIDHASTFSAPQDSVEDLKEQIKSGYLKQSPP
jgi:hypothetical protein